MSIGTSQAFRTQNLRLLGNLFDKNNFIGKKGYYLNSTGDGVDWRADINESSGIFYGGVISATIGGTTFNITAGSGQVITRVLLNNEIVTTNAIVSWNAQNNIALTYRTTHQFSYLYIDENGALQQQNSPFTDSEYKNKIILGTISHINLSTINLVVNKQNTAYGDSHRLYEFANAFGPIKRSGLSIGPYSTNLRITRGAGSAFSIGSNYASDQFEADSPDIAAANPALINRVYRNGSGGFIFDSNSGSFYTDIDPTKYDNGSGTLQTVNNNQWTIQRLFFFPINVNEIVVYYGDAIYNSSVDAIAAISTEPFSESIITSENAVFLGYLVTRGGAADLSSSNDGVFFQSGAFRSVGAVAGGGVGSVVTTLDELTDVQIATPLGGQFLTYDSTTSFWKNRSFILDENNNELIKFPSTIASAVNELTISNAATTGSPSISATGDDTNIGLNLISKGTGLVQINGKAISLANSFTASGNFALTFTTTATTSLTLPTSGTLATTSQIPTVNNATLTLAGSGGIGIDSPPTFTANASADKTITISIADGALAISKLADIATLRILGRTSGSTGPVQELDGSGVVTVIGSNAVTRATNLAAGSAGQIPYQSGANTTGFSAAGSANQVLLSGGSGAPTWANQSSLTVGVANSLANALTINSPLTGTSYNGSAAISIGLQNASDSQAGGVSIGAQTFAGNKTFKDNVIVSGNLTVNGSTVTINSSTLSVDDKNIELGAVVAIASLSSTVNIDAGDANVIVSSTSGLIVGQALTKISGTGNFGTNPIITSITSATQFTVSPVHATTGSIVFSVGGATDVTADGGGITLKGTTDKTILWVDSTDAWTLSEHLNIASGKSYRINGSDVLSSTTLGSGVVNSSLTSVGTLTNLTVTNTITGSVSGSAGSLSGTYTFWGQSFNGTQNVSGNLTSVGNITGSSGITITAGGSNQNVVLTPSGTGYTLLNGSVGIGNSTPNNKLTIQAGDNKDSGPIINLGGNAINQFESGRIRFTEVVTGAAPFYEGAYLHYDGSNNLFHIGVHNTNDALIANDVNAISIVRSSGNVGIGTTNPLARLSVGSGSLDDGNIPIQTSSLGSNTERWIGINKNGAYGLILGYYEGSGLSGVGAYVRQVRSDPLYFLVNGSTMAMSIVNNGNIGIGNTPPNNKLAISGSVSIGSNYNVAASTNGLIVEGSVGIGTTNPAAKLAIGANPTYAAGVTLIVGTPGNPSSSGTSQPYANLRLGTNTGNSQVLDFGIYDASPYGSWIQAAGGGNLAFPSPLILNPTGGNVGIGVSNPTALLTIYNTAFDNNTDGFKFGYSSAYHHSFSASFNSSASLNNLGININNGFNTGRTRVLTLLGNGNIGIGITSPSAVLHVNSAVSGATLLRADGTNGTLFSVVDDLSDSLMSVNNSAGLPVLEVFADDRVVMGQYGQNDLVVINNKVGIGIANPINKLSVIGAANIGDSTYNVAAPTNGLIVQGNVGIGNIAPTYKLDVAGSAYAYNYFTLLTAASYGPSDNSATIQVFGSTGSGGLTNTIKFVIGGNEKWRITNAGVLQSSGAQTIQTDGGVLTLATAINGNIILSPHGTGNVGIGDTTTTAKLDVNGTVRVRSISASGSAATIFLTTDANGILISRTAAQVRSDIGAGTGNGTVTSVTGSGGLASSGGTTPDISIATDGVTTAKILNSNVTLAKIQNVAISTVLGNSSASAAQAPVEINMTTLATMLSGKTMDIVGTATNVTGVVLIANGGTGTATTTANAFFVGPNGSSGAPSFRAMATADIPASIVTFAKIQDVAGPTLIGRVSATSGPVAALSSANARSVIGATTVGSNLITLADTSTTKKYIEVGADNTVTLLEAAAFRNAIGAGTGNGTVTNVTGNEGITSSGGTTPNISITNGGVTYAKIQNVSATSRILGRISANAGVIEELTGANVATIIGANAIENATNVNITTDDATNSSYYLYFGANASGNTPLKASTKIRYNPSSGAFSATTKSFRIPHPTKPQHDLVYGSLESPYHGIRLTGKGKTSGNRAEIILPDYVKVLIDEETINIQLTVIKCAKILYIDDIFINDNKFTVKYDKSWYEKSKDVEFYWDFTAERKDVPKLIVEEKI